MNPETREIIQCHNALVSLAKKHNFAVELFPEHCVIHISRDRPVHFRSLEEAVAFLQGYDESIPEDAKLVLKEDVVDD